MVDEQTKNWNFFKPCVNKYNISRFDYIFNLKQQKIIYNLLEKKKSNILRDLFQSENSFFVEFWCMFFTPGQGLLCAVSTKNTLLSLKVQSSFICHCVGIQGNTCYQVELEQLSLRLQWQFSHLPNWCKRLVKSFISGVSFFCTGVRSFSESRHSCPKDQTTSAFLEGAFTSRCFFYSWQWAGWDDEEVGSWWIS